MVPGLRHDQVDVGFRSGRLALYLYAADRVGSGPISSATIGESAGVNPTQVRRDFMALGVPGKRGVGYSAPDLAVILRRALLPNRETVEDLAELYRVLHEQLAHVAERLL